MWPLAHDKEWIKLVFASNIFIFVLGTWKGLNISNSLNIIVKEVEL